MSFPLNDKFYTVKRCGIIPYCKVDAEKYKILLGLKTNYGRYYGDIGGGIKKNETYLNGLIREIFEESSTLIFTNKSEILDALSKSTTIFYHVKDGSSVLIEFLVPIDNCDTYITSFPNYNIKEHCEFRWFNVQKIGGEFQIINFDIKQQLDGSIKPLINQILSSFNLM